MQISVIVAAFNADHFIGRAISSVQKQTIRDLEIIVVDDASTDNTHSLVQNLAEKDSCNNIIQLTSNTGPSGARNIGFAAAKGEWIAGMPRIFCSLRKCFYVAAVHMCL